MISMFWVLAGVAQEHFLGIQGGGGLFGLRSPHPFFQGDGRIGFTGGLSYAYHYRERLVIGLDALYLQKGIRSDTEFLNNGNHHMVKLNYDYLSFPIKVGVQFGGTIYSQIFVGIVPAVLLSGQHYLPMPINGIGRSKFVVTDDMMRFDIGGTLETSIGIRRQKWNFFISGAFQQSFSSFSSYYYFPFTEVRHHGLRLSLGIKYQLR